MSETTWTPEHPDELQDGDWVECQIGGKRLAGEVYHADCSPQLPSGLTLANDSNEYFRPVFRDLTVTRRRVDRADGTYVSPRDDGEALHVVRLKDGRVTHGWRLDASEVGYTVACPLTNPGGDMRERPDEWMRVAGS